MTDDAADTDCCSGFDGLMMVHWSVDCCGKHSTTDAFSSIVYCCGHLSIWDYVIYDLDY